MPDLWRSYQEFRHDLIEETRRSGLTPSMVADALESEAAADFRRAGYVLSWEISAYRRSPDDWRGVVLPS